MAEFPASKDFVAHLHTAFKIETPAALELELTEVHDRSNAQLEQFSVIFTGPASPWLQQGTYTLLHPQMQGLTLFLVPLGPRDGRMVYEAVFARLIPPSTQALGAGRLDQ
jgi:hypothetical protein